MKSIKVNINQHPITYDIIVGNNILKDCLNNIKSYNKALIIHDSVIHSDIIELIKNIVKDNGMIVETKGIGLHNSPKSISTFVSMSDYLSLNDYNRDCLLISLGGGSIGDLVGFLASTYQRGVDYIQIPSTLLSMIDSSIGGKTGLDTKYGKNLIGSFYHPAMVVIDTLLLSSLEKKELNSGLFEVLKYAILFDQRLFDFIDTNLDNIVDPNIINNIINECCAIKVKIIQDDERDLGDRKKLNFGHTIGHAIETKYGLRHGESVGYGMLCASNISNQIGTLSDSRYDKIKNLIKRLYLPPLSPDVDLIMNQLSKDKKVVDGKNQFILLNDIGNAYISNDIDKNIIKNSILSL